MFYKVARQMAGRRYARSSSDRASRRLSGPENTPRPALIIRNCYANSTAINPRLRASRRGVETIARRVSCGKSGKERTRERERFTSSGVVADDNKFIFNLSDSRLIYQRRAGLTVPHICGEKKPRSPTIQRIVRFSD